MRAKPYTQLSSLRGNTQYCCGNLHQLLKQQLLLTAIKSPLDEDHHVTP